MILYVVVFSYSTLKERKKLFECRSLHGTLLSVRDKNSFCLIFFTQVANNGHDVEQSLGHFLNILNFFSVLLPEAANHHHNLQLHLRHFSHLFVYFFFFFTVFGGNMTTTFVIHKDNRKYSIQSWVLADIFVVFHMFAY